MIFHINANQTPLPINRDGCTRCIGTGYLLQHRRVSDGVCFKCEGTGDPHHVKETELSRLLAKSKTPEVIATAKAQVIRSEENSSFTAIIRNKIKAESVIEAEAAVETNKLNDEQYQIMRRHFLG